MTAVTQPLGMAAKHRRLPPVIKAAQEEQALTGVQITSAVLCCWCARPSSCLCCTWQRYGKHTAGSCGCLYAIFLQHITHSNLQGCTAADAVPCLGATAWRPGLWRPRLQRTPGAPRLPWGHCAALAASIRHRRLSAAPHPSQQQQVGPQVLSTCSAAPKPWSCVAAGWRTGGVRRGRRRRRARRCVWRVQHRSAGAFCRELPVAAPAEQLHAKSSHW